MNATPTAEAETAAAVASQQVLVIMIDRRNSGLERVMSLFRRRGPEFSSMHIEPSTEPDVVRMTVYFTATAEAVDHAVLHLHKIVDIHALHKLNL